MSRQQMVATVFGLATACSLPPFEYEGDHVVVGSDVVDQVCAGTIERLDLAVEHIDERLGLPETDERVSVAIVELAEALKLCGGYRGEAFRGACASREGNKTVAVLSPSIFEAAAAHEIAHVRVGRRRSGNVGLFSEGIAVALSPAICSGHGELPRNNDLLLISSGWNMGNAEYYLGGELVAWLLDTHGHEPVMSFLGTLVRPEALDPNNDPEFVRSSYRSHFGSDLDEDLYQHLRDPGEMSAKDLGCVAPEARWTGDRVHLQADLDCGSDRVQNNFLVSSHGFVDWTLDIPTAEPPRRYRLLDSIPAGTWIEIRRCTCDLHRVRRLVVWNEKTPIGSSVELSAGAYLVRWHGRLNGDAELNIAIEAYGND